MEAKIRGLQEKLNRLYEDGDYDTIERAQKQLESLLEEWQYSDPDSYNRYMNGA